VHQAIPCKQNARNSAYGQGNKEPIDDDFSKLKIIPTS
jgi:hypothetical protein